jgi:(2Fe-2S) ferredoxin
MALPEKQILVCQSFRTKGDPKGICHKQTDGFLQYIEEEILDRGLDSPVMVVQPENWWYKGVTSTEVIDAILDSIEDGEPAADYLIQ